MCDKRGGKKDSLSEFNSLPPTLTFPLSAFLSVSNIAVLMCELRCGNGHLCVLVIKATLEESEGEPSKRSQH